MSKRFLNFSVCRRIPLVWKIHVYEDRRRNIDLFPPCDIRPLGLLGDNLTSNTEQICIFPGYRYCCDIQSS